MRIGVFGGTFDPIHFGHLRVAQEVTERMTLDRVLFMPAGCPPHRRVPHASARHRFAMTQCAVSGNPKFAASDIELTRTGKSYTIDTLQILADKYAKANLFLLIGADQCVKLHKWYRSLELFDFCRVVAISRPGNDLHQIQAQLRDDFPPAILRKISFHKVSALEISSTEIRKAARQKRSIRYLVPKKVQDYIIYHQLYQIDENVC
ncbi:nicotinate-nucleotide adenylyltransferase [bacterium]|nr:nicotinate-nucleotide adenylyltransferase [bacterium]